MTTDHTNVVSLVEYRNRRAEAALADKPAAGTATVSVAADQPPGLDLAALKAAYDATQARLAKERADANARTAREYGLNRPGTPNPRRPPKGPSK
jgi:hypothetical protein